MPLYAGELNVRRGAPLAEFPAPLSEVLRAQSEETQLHNPTQALRRMLQMTDAERGEVLPPESDLDAEIRRAPVKKLDAETARARVQEEGLKLTIPDEGISEKSLDILLKRKRDEVRRQDIFSRGPSGVGAGAARLSTALVESLFDPLNIASAFVPIVGPARYAAMVRAAASPLSRAAVRAEVGAIEGAVGAAILEPLIYSAARQEQLDYTMYDSLANVAFGGVFGGGLHVAGGAVADAFRVGAVRATELPAHVQPSARDVAVAADFDSRQVALRTSVAQAVEGRTTEVAPLLETQRGMDERQPDIVFHGSPVAGGITELRASDGGELGPGLYITRDESLAKNYAQPRGEVENMAEALKQSGVVRVDVGDVKLKDITKEEYLSDRARFFAEEQRLNGGEWDGGVFDRAVSKLTQKYMDEGFDGLYVRDEKQGVVFPDRLNRARLQQPARISPEKVRSAAQENAKTVRSAEPQSSVMADEIQKAEKPTDLASAQEELTEALNVAKGYADALGREPDLTKFDEAISRTQDYAKALKVAAACGLA